MPTPLDATIDALHHEFQDQMLGLLNMVMVGHPVVSIILIIHFEQDRAFYTRVSPGLDARRVL
jgi:hypothetical protein